MKLTLKLKLPNDKSLNDAINLYTEALNYLSEQIFENKTPLSLNEIHKKYYFDLRTRFELFSTMAQCVIRDIINAYTTLLAISKEILNPIVFKNSHLTFQHNYNYKIDVETQSVYIKIGKRRTRFPVVFCDYYKNLLSKATKITEGTLVKKRREGFYFCIVIEVPEGKVDYQGVIGIDVGIKKLATLITQKGKTLLINGNPIVDKRHKAIHLRKRLQSKGTRRAKRILIRLSGKERRCITDYIYCAVNEILNFCVINKIGYIGVEDLSTRMMKKHKTSKKHRGILYAWPYRKLLNILKYKSELMGLMLFDIHPANTSTTCSYCGYIHKRNRKKQNLFICKECGWQDNADINAARNILHGTLIKVSAYAKASVDRSAEVLTKAGNEHLSRFNESDGVAVVRPDVTSADALT